jgi:hypothetical protein
MELALPYENESSIFWQDEEVVKAYKQQKQKQQEAEAEFELQKLHASINQSSSSKYSSSYGGSSSSSSSSSNSGSSGGVNEGSSKSPGFKLIKGVRITASALRRVVDRNGGIDNVINQRLWQNVRNGLKIPFTSSAGSQLKKAYIAFFGEESFTSNVTQPTKKMNKKVYNNQNGRKRNNRKNRSNGKYNRNVLAPPPPMPILNFTNEGQTYKMYNVEITPSRLWNLVCRSGGFDQVTILGLWNEIAEMFWSLHVEDMKKKTPHEMIDKTSPFSGVDNTLELQSIFIQYFCQPFPQRPRPKIVTLSVPSAPVSMPTPPPSSSASSSTNDITTTTTNAPLYQKPISDGVRVIACDSKPQGTCSAKAVEGEGASLYRIDGNNEFVQTFNISENDKIDELFNDQLDGDGLEAIVGDDSITSGRNGQSLQSVVSFPSHNEIYFLVC